MRTFSRGMALAVLVCGSAAYADRNDISLTKLGNPATDPEANGNFRAFARTFAAVMTSANLMPPETLGHAGFSLNAELSVVGLPSPGTGDGQLTMPTEGDPTNPLLIPSVHVRKGLPFSFELGARVGWIDRSDMFTATGEVKWAVNEGFTWLPDVAVRAHVTRLMGNKDFDLTAGGLDFGVGKQFPLGGMVTLTPYGGLDLVGVAASSDTLDFNPSRPRAGVPTTPPSTPTSALDNTGVYETVKLGENINSRLYGGVRFIGGALQLGAEVSLSNQGFIEVKNAAGEKVRDRAVPAVLAFSTTLGLDF